MTVDINQNIIDNAIYTILNTMGVMGKEGFFKIEYSFV